MHFEWDALVLMLAGLAFGGLLIGFVVSLLRGMPRGIRSPCPHCGASIAHHWLVCPRCRRDLFPGSGWQK